MPRAGFREARQDPIPVRGDRLKLAVLLYDHPGPQMSLSSKQPSTSPEVKR